jgi:Phage tail protein
MLNKVEIRNSQGALLTLEFEDVTDGLVLQEIEGLDPVKATIASSTFAKLKGKQFHASRSEERNIKIKLGLQPDYVTTSVQDLRDRLYNFFMPEGMVSLRLYRSEGLVVDISGIVESCEAPLFSKEPEMDISILCMQPDFVNLTAVTVSGTSVSTTTETLVPYAGNANTGMTFTLNVNRTLTQFTFYFRPPDGTLRILDFAASLISGDVVTISTVPGSKFATKTRAGVVTSVLYGVSPQSNWHQLAKGDNHIRIYAVGAAIPYSIQYLERYGGL